MKVCYCRVSDKINKIKNHQGQISQLEADMMGWQRGGDDIKYGHSSLNHLIRKAEVL